LDVSTDPLDWTQCNTPNVERPHKRTSEQIYASFMRTSHSISIIPSSTLETHTHSRNLYICPTVSQTCHSLQTRNRSTASQTAYNNLSKLVLTNTVTYFKHCNIDIYCWNINMVQWIS
jgi:glutaminase